MATHPLAGQPAPASSLIDPHTLLTAYLAEKPDPAIRAQRVSFGTSGHRGSSLKRSFNEQHILAVTQAICDYRLGQATTGPLYLGIDTHALSQPACDSALEVLAANGVDVMIDRDGGYTPTPVISHAILQEEKKKKRGQVLQSHIVLGKLSRYGSSPATGISRCGLPCDQSRQRPAGYCGGRP